MKDKNNLCGTQEHAYNGMLTHAGDYSGDTTEWYMTAEGIEAMKAEDARIYEESRAPKKKVTLGRSFDVSSYFK